MVQTGEKVKKAFIFFLSLVICFSLINSIVWPVRTAKAATSLSAGDIVFVGLNADGDDEFSFLLLKDISANTEIYFTDKGWDDSNGFSSFSGDGIGLWISDADMSAGDVINIKTTNCGVVEPDSLSASQGNVSWVEQATISFMGDQIFLYQGTHEAPTFIAGIHYNVFSDVTNQSNWDGESNSNCTSALPDDLKDGVNAAVWVSDNGTESDNFIYNNTLMSGTPQQLREAINNESNWLTDNVTPLNIQPYVYNFTVQSPDTAPTVAITSAEGEATNSSPFSVTIAFNEDVSGFTQEDITIGNATSSNFTNTVVNREWTVDVTPLGEGTVTVDVDANVCVDSADNGNEAATQFSIAYDITPPTVTLSALDGNPTDISPFRVRILFSEPVTGFSTGDLIVGNGSASMTGCVAAQSWNYNITPNAEGEVTVDMNAGVCTDKAGNANIAAAQLSVDYDVTPPMVLVNGGFVVAEGASKYISALNMKATDTVADDSSLIYVVTSLPINGNLYNDGTKVLLNGTFTQQDINDGKIRYTHNDSETTVDSYKYKVTDGLNNSDEETLSIAVSLVNEEPSLSTTGFNPTFIEGGAGVALFGSTYVSTVEAGQMINALTLTVTNVVGSGDEILIIDGTSVALTHGNSQTTAGNSLSCTVSKAGNTATVTLSGTLSCAQTVTLVDTIAYKNTSDVPVGSNRVVTITALRDNGGTINGGDDTAAMNFTSSVTVVAVNDDPTILGLPTDVTVEEDIASSVNLSLVTIYDDSGENPITLTIEASAGTLTASSNGGVTVSGSGLSCLTLTGTVGKINSYLGTVSNIKYTGPENAYGNNVATLTFTANDGGNTGTGGGTDINFGTLNVDITEISDLPSVDVNTGINLNEGATASITTTQLAVSDVDSSMSWMSFVITDGPSNGQLESSDNPGVPIAGFSWQNIVDGKILYVHDDSNTTSDSFTFKVNDGDGGVLTGQTFSITVNAVDDDTPTIVKNEGLALTQGTTKAITTTELLVTDEDSADSLLIYTVATQPLNGRLENSDYPGVSISIFTQQNVVDGKIKYVHDGSSTMPDSFTFSVSDNNANVLSGQTFNITVNSLPTPTPTPTPTPSPVPTITPSPTQEPGDKTRTLCGELLDSNGNPKVGYVVELHSTPITAITDSQGRYRFDNVDYTAHTLFVKTPTGKQITSFALSFEEGDKFSKTVKADGADIQYTNSTVSVDITIALDGDEDSAKITEISGVDNPATGRTPSLLIWILMAAFAVTLIGSITLRKIRVRE